MSTPDVDPGPVTAEDFDGYKAGFFSALKKQCNKLLADGTEEIDVDVEGLPIADFVAYMQAEGFMCYVEGVVKVKKRSVL